MAQSVNYEATVEAIKAAPPVVFTAAWLHGLTINDLVAIATFCYVVLQIGLLAPKYYRLWKRCKWRDQ